MNRAVRDLAIAVVLPGFFFGCASSQDVRTSASMAKFLFPSGTEPVSPPEHQAVRLETPMRVGLAFVPSWQPESFRQEYTLPPDVKLELLERVQGAFRDLPFVEELVLIPESFLDPSQGLGGLRRAARSFGVDAVALLGYDQVQFSDTTPGLGILHLTLVGQFVVPAQRNATRTLMEASVFDVASGSLLMHARATDVEGSRSTLAGTEARLRSKSVASFRSATDALIAALDEQLGEFEKAVQDGEPIYGRQVEIASLGAGGGTGRGGAAAGDLGAFGAVLALLAVAAARGARRRPA